MYSGLQGDFVHSIAYIKQTTTLKGECHKILDFRFSKSISKQMEEVVLIFHLKGQCYERVFALKKSSIRKVLNILFGHIWGSRVAI